MNERLNGVGVFVAVVEAGSFAVAAQRLAVTRSAVAKTIARLEQRLKVRLFNRTTRKQSLTENGHAYYERCVRALAELEAAEECIESGRREPAGKLRVTMPVLFGRRCVAPILLALSERYPELQLEMSFNDRVVDLVEEGFDLAIRVGALPDSSQLVARRLGMQRMGICAAPAYLDRHGRPSSPSELDGHLRLAYLTAGRASAWRVHDEDGGVVLPQVKTRLGFDDLQAIADAAIAGAGLAWLPCWMMAPELKTGRLELVVSGDRVPGTEIHALWSRMTHLPMKVRVAVDALVSEIPRMLSQ
ncbi:LysR family transcriptional regulator [Steroidobacter agaridevorans]|uniref:LysR family transcriptional regulator n=1 Tax=Steroidobacter agaridevorans TaxID=2695856 RepID=A0A829YGK4_9GAMM|nr:LysR family transcriptional regulator [Steroidobacter agaridevorans]GFE81928.1 LysR family transcriptional regulator [Steroidobacter agaridevorans]GFE85682.1 LysR family transcriptional regulator [Steroidobacter agaridevorans]